MVTFARYFWDMKYVVIPAVTITSRNTSVIIPRAPEDIPIIEEMEFNFAGIGHKGSGWGNGMIKYSTFSDFAMTGELQSDYFQPAARSKGVLEAEEDLVSEIIGAIVGRKIPDEVVAAGERDVARERVLHARVQGEGIVDALLFDAFDGGNAIGQAIPASSAGGR